MNVQVITYVLIGVSDPLHQKYQGSHQSTFLQNLPEQKFHPKPGAV